MLKSKIITCIIAFPLMLFSQDVVKTSNYSIRDFIVDNDSLYYLEHTELYLNDLKNDKTATSFVGGFGLEFYDLSKSELLIVANELIKDVTSFRFYNKKSNKIVESFFYRGGKAIDFLKIPEFNVFAFSTTNKKIIVVNFDNKKDLKKIIEIDLASLSRRLFYKDMELFYCTDDGEIYSYSLHNYEKKLIHKTDTSISDFILNDDILVYSTIDGIIVKRDLNTKKEQKINIKSDFVLTSLMHQNTLMCGSWQGNIFVIDLKEFKIAKNLEYHKAPVLKILNYKDSVFYSSSIDKTIKKWIFK